LLEHGVVNVREEHPRECFLYFFGEPGARVDGNEVLGHSHSLHLAVLLGDRANAFFQEELVEEVEGNLAEGFIAVLSAFKDG